MRKARLPIFGLTTDKVSPAGAPTRRGVGLARVATETARAADLLSRAERGLRGPDRQGLERARLRRRLRHALRVDAAFAARYPVRQAGGETILELWVPAEELAEFNRHIVGRAEVVREFRPEGEVPR